jgi:hypothetical protein
MAEQATLRYVTHEQLDNDEELVHGLVESWSKRGYGRASDRLLQMGMRLCIRQLNRSDPANIIQVASKLRVPGGWGESGLRDELVGLRVKVVVKIISQKQVNERCLIKRYEFHSYAIRFLEDRPGILHLVSVKQCVAPQEGI